ncbi:hypothetical protein EMPG_14104, partial [Blastomyces silverae]
LDAGLTYPSHSIALVWKLCSVTRNEWRTSPHLGNEGLLKTFQSRPNLKGLKAFLSFIRFFRAVFPALFRIEQRPRLPIYKTVKLSGTKASTSPRQEYYFREEQKHTRLPEA